MRIMLLAAAAALSLGVGSAYADKERTTPLPSPSAPSEVADNTDSGANAVIPDSIDRAPVVPAAKGRRQDRHWILLY
jgi:adenine/guanine phosphoribosyltransferase-like PRPP-binding protein